MPDFNLEVLHRLVSGMYTTLLLRWWVATCALSPLLYDWLWPHNDDYTNAYSFWGAGYTVIIFLFNFSLGLAPFYALIILQEKITSRLKPFSTKAIATLIALFIAMLLTQMAMKAWLFSLPFFKLFKDAGGPTFAAAALSLLLLWWPVSRKIQL